MSENKSKGLARAEGANARGAKRTDARLSSAPERSDELAPLLDVARRAKRTLRPVMPPPAFRAHLRDGLLMAARHQQTPHLVVEKQSQPKWGWIISAAAIGSAAGLIVIALRSRTGRRTAAPPRLHPPD